METFQAIREALPCFSEADGSGFIRNANFRRDLRERYAGGYV
jgi:hypothetical protein